MNHPIGDWIRTTYPEYAFLLIGLLSIVGVVAVGLGTVPILIYMERKVSAHMQARLGPMRVGFHGILQAFADSIKLIFKEVLVPKGADKFIFFFAPILPVSASFIILALIPFDYNLQAVEISAGIPVVLAVSGLGVLGILIGGWGSNSKYSLLGSMRAGAQMVSYEVSVALGMLFVVLITGSASLREIVLTQQGTIINWWIFKIPGLGFIAFCFFLVSSCAELNRGPFDLAEAEQEITGGFHTEYSGMTFALFFLAEYVNMVIAAALCSIFFLGGFLAPQFGIPGIDPLLASIPGFVWMGIKIFTIIFIYMWMRWTFPRPRMDQLMLLEWKFLIPANLLLLVLGAIFIALGWVF